METIRRKHPHLDNLAIVLFVLGAAASLFGFLPSFDLSTHRLFRVEGCAILSAAALLWFLSAAPHRLGIGNPALRTARCRLKAAGWVTSHKMARALLLPPNDRILGHLNFWLKKQNWPSETLPGADPDTYYAPISIEQLFDHPDFPSLFRVVSRLSTELAGRVLFSEALRSECCRRTPGATTPRDLLRYARELANDFRMVRRLRGPDADTLASLYDRGLVPSNAISNRLICDSPDRFMHFFGLWLSANGHRFETVAAGGWPLRWFKEVGIDEIVSKPDFPLLIRLICGPAWPLFVLTCRSEQARANCLAGMLS